MYFARLRGLGRRPHLDLSSSGSTTGVIFYYLVLTIDLMSIAQNMQSVKFYAVDYAIADVGANSPSWPDRHSFMLPM